MDISLTMVIYLTVYVITIIYFVMLGCYMLALSDSPKGTHGEHTAKRRMTRTMGIAMFVEAFEWFVYLPPMLYGVRSDDPIYRVFTLIMFMLTTPVFYIIMFAVVQRKVNVAKWTFGLGAPFLLLAVWQFIAPPPNSMNISLSI